MSVYTNPIETTFELQRQSLKQGQALLTQGVDVQQQVGKSVIAGIESQEQFQRRFVEFNQDAVTDTLEILEETSGLDSEDSELRANLDDGYDELLSRHAELFDTITKELGEHGIDPSEELSADLLETIDEQLDLLLETHEELEAQSVEAVDDLESQLTELREQVGDVNNELADEVEELREQASEVQDQIRQVSEDAADAVEN